MKRISQCQRPVDRIPDSSRPIRDLQRTLVARIRGNAAVLGYDSDSLADGLRSCGKEVLSAAWPQDLAAIPAGSLGTLILWRLLERLDEEPAHRVLEAAWDRVLPGGWLLVIVPNEDLDPGNTGVRRMTRRSLRRELRSLQTPRLHADQPLRWLVMSLEKPGSDRPRLSRTDRNRARVTAKYCRGRVADLGCGPGHLSGLIHQRGHEVVGVDLSREKIRIARELYPGVTFLAGDIRTVPLPDGAFDTAVLTEVLEHVPEPVGDEILARAARLVRPGGRLVVSVPNEDCVPHKNHLRVFDRNSLRKLLKPYGTTRTVADQPFKWLLMVVNLPS